MRPRWREKRRIEEIEEGLSVCPRDDDLERRDTHIERRRAKNKGRMRISRIPKRRDQKRGSDDHEESMSYRRGRKARGGPRGQRRGSDPWRGTLAVAGGERCVQGGPALFLFLDDGR